MQIHLETIVGMDQDACKEGRKAFNEVLIKE
jgi:hypothetical protein